MRHSLLLGKWKELFFWFPIEELIQSRQKEYYDALGMADKQADSAGFVEFYNVTLLIQPIHKFLWQP